ncbi:MAG: crotonase/enoyl-CoA hydratase family protein [Nitratireductor sp.]|nr:crotonase/enoyl-CoA hydratase family protein [Nitratireductor sp.]MCB1422387.1 crotonase/enoyl-CoA hydratase family protein [Nitratireductor sp.]
MTTPIEVAVENGVQTIRLNRPEKKNAITSAMYAAMAEAIKAGWADDAVRATLFLGTPGAFSSGNDIADFMQVAMSGERGSMAVFDFLEAIIMSQKPLVAGVDGLAIGVGVTMLMHCDYAVASDRSQFKTPFVDLGLVPEAGSSLLAPMLMSHHKAFELLAMGEGWSAEDAREAGFVNRITGEDDLEAAAIAAAGEIAAKPPEAMKLSRDLIRGDRSPILARMREEAEIFGERLKSDEAKAAFMAFMAKGQKKAG